MNLSSLANVKSINRVTGTPENFLTALRFGTWGFHPDKEREWNTLKPGDIIYFHSTASKSKFVRTSKSCVIGFGVVGDHFFKDSQPLWIDEYLDPTISYPYKFKFSEIYLFADIKVDDSWDSTSFDKKERTVEVIKEVVEAGVPLSSLGGFPAMGSYSSIKKLDVREKLLDLIRDIYHHTFDNDADETDAGLESELIEIKSTERIRVAKSLLVFKDIQQHVVKSKFALYKVDQKHRSKAEEAHFLILNHLDQVFREKGFNLYFNDFIDLFVYKGDHCILIEAKSLENNNLRSQTRKSISQLLEYNYYEINKFKKDHNLKFIKEDLVLATSRVPQDENYITFVNSLNIKTIAVQDERILNYGESIDFSKL